MDLNEVMRTTFAAREFTDEPVSDEALYRILDHARFAPSGGNRQGWKVIVVRDRATRRALAELSVETARRYIAQVKAGENPWNTIEPTRLTEEEIRETPVRWPMLESMPDIPVVLVIGLDLRVVASIDSELDRVGVISGASIYPFVWNILLQARSEGLGGTITTFVAAEEPKVQHLLGLPPYIAVSALVPIGHPVKQLTRLRRKPVGDFAFIDRFGGEPFTTD